MGHVTRLDGAIALAGAWADALVVLAGVVVAAGLCAGAAFAAVRVALDRVAAEPERPPAWSAPFVVRLPARSAWRPRWLERSDAGTVAQDLALRELALELGLAPGGARCVMFTGVTGVNGTSSITASLALRLASEGQSVVVMDVDLLRPTLAQALAVPAEPNLGTALQTGELADAARPVRQTPSLRLVAGLGDARVGTLAALGALLPDLVAQARADGSHVLLESTPLDASPDVLALLEAVDDLVLVARAGRVGAGVLEATSERLARYGRTARGIVLVGSASASRAPAPVWRPPDPAAIPELVTAGEPSDGRPAARDELLSPGDRVQWNCGRHTVTGIVERRLTAPATVAGRRVEASEDEPRYVIRSERTGKQAARRAGALVKLTDGRPAE